MQLGTKASAAWASDRQIFARVLDTTTSTVIVDDPGSLVYSALNAVVQGFVIVDVKASLLGVEASSVYSLLPVYDVNTDTTSIDAASGIFNSGMVGMAFYPDSTQRNAYEIKRYVSSQNIIVAGNVKGIEDTNTTMQVCRRGIITEESGRVLLDVDAAFTNPISGWRVELNLEKPAILNLGGYVSASKMQLQGDPLFLADLRTERYHIAAPPGVCGPNTGTSYSATGATADPRDRNKANASNPGSRYLWAGYMYLTPIVGVWNGSSIQGSQSGINKLGQYHCWNRTYDVSTGRWTTPDPAVSPWWNLEVYSLARPISNCDPSGLWVGVDDIGKVTKDKDISGDTPLPEIPRNWGGHGKSVADEAREAYNKCLVQCNKTIVGDNWEESWRWTDAKRAAVIACMEKCEKYRQRYVWAKGSKLYDPFVEDFEGLPDRTDALWKHGNYCGPGQASGSPAPTDGLDACCKAHDDCYGGKDGPGEPLDADVFFKLKASPQQLARARYCNAILKDCVNGMGFNCGSPGDKIAKQIKTFFDVWELLYALKGVAKRIF